MFSSDPDWVIAVICLTELWIPSTGQVRMGNEEDHTDRHIAELSEVEERR